MKHYRQKLKYLVPAGALSLAAAGSALAEETGIDYSPIVNAVDFGDMSTVVLAVAGALAGIYVLIKGVRVALGFVRGG